MQTWRLALAAVVAFLVLACLAVPAPVSGEPSPPLPPPAAPAPAEGDDLSAAALPIRTQPLWRALLLVYPSIDVTYLDSNGALQRLTYTMPAQEIADGVGAFRQYIALANRLSKQEALVAGDIVRIGRTLNSLSDLGSYQYWISPNDTRAELDVYAPVGRYDSVFVLWPQTNLTTRQQIPSPGWGLAIQPSGWSNEATYATVANADTSLWDMPTAGEIWLHEWLHGVSAYYAGQGYRIPTSDADGGSGHGYSWSPETGWSAYYADLMTGRVLENGSRRGITADAWRSGSVAGPRFHIFADYFSLDPLAGYTVAGSATWQGTPTLHGHVLLGTSTAADNRISRAFTPQDSFVMTGRLQIPASGAGPYDSVSLALANGGTQYWATLLYGSNLVERNHIEIMRSDRHTTLVPMDLQPGWYTVRMLVDKSSNNLSMKAWRDGQDEPAAWQTTEPLAEGWKPTAVGFRHFGQGARVDDLTAIPWADAAPYPDLVFADGFETGDLAGWSKAVVDQGDLSGSTRAALAGRFGMRAAIDDDKALYAVDYTPAALWRYRARFYFDPHSLKMARGDSHTIFRVFDRVRNVVRINLVYTATGYQIEARVLQDNLSWRVLPLRALPNEPAAVEIYWRASNAGARNGAFTLWINGANGLSVSDLDNDTFRLESAWLGPQLGIDPGTSGSYYFDDFVSRRTNYIGRNTIESLRPIGFGGAYASELAESVSSDALIEAAAADLPQAAAVLGAGAAPELTLAGADVQATVALAATPPAPVETELRFSDDYAPPDGFLPAAQAVELAFGAEPAEYLVRLRRSDHGPWTGVSVVQLNAAGTDWEPVQYWTEEGGRVLVMRSDRPTVLIPIAVEEQAGRSLYLPAIVAP